MSPSGPVTQDRTARRLRAVAWTLRAAHHHLAGVRNCFPAWLFPSVSINRPRSARSAGSPPVGLLDRPNRDAAAPAEFASSKPEKLLKSCSSSIWINVVLRRSTTTVSNPVAVVPYLVNHGSEIRIESLVGFGKATGKHHVR